MNNLIPVTYDGERQTVSGRELHEFLVEQETFKDFFIVVSEIKVCAQHDFLKDLRDEVRKFSLRFGSDAITLLCDSITAEMVLPCKNIQERKANEGAYKKYLVDNFDSLFPSYKYLGQEIQVNKIGRIDILAECRDSGRTVIIELKIGSLNPNKQLIAYGSNYENPILIGITESPISPHQRLSDILYFTYEELGSGDGIVGK